MWQIKIEINRAMVSQLIDIRMVKNMKGNYKP